MSRALEGLTELGNHDPHRTEACFEQYALSLCQLAVAQLGHFRAVSACFERPTDDVSKQSPQHQLAAAAHFGQLDHLQAFVQQDVSISTPSDVFGLPLQVSAAQGHVAVVRYLLEQGADPAAGAPPSHIVMQVAKGQPGLGSTVQAASRAGKEAIVRLVLTESAKPFASERGFQLAVLAATRGGHKAILDLLLAWKGSPLRASRLRDSILLEASIFGQAHLVCECLDQGASINFTSPFDRRCSTPLSAAVARGNTAMINLLILRGAKPDSPRVNYLDLAARGGFITVPHALLNGAPLPRHAGTDAAMMTAASRGHAEFVSYLLDMGARAVPWALCKAAESGSDGVVRLLASKGAPVDGEGHPEHLEPMVLAMCQGHEHTVRALLELGARKVDPLQSIYADDFASGKYPRKI